MENEKDFGEGVFVIDIKKVGSGTYGDVYKGKMKDSNEIIAIKKIKNKNY